MLELSADVLRTVLLADFSRTDEDDDGIAGSLSVSELNTRCNA
jgi:hypothetical protein